MNKKPKFYYGYVVVVASAIIMVVGWGNYHSYGVFFESFVAEFGWTRALTSSVFAVSALVRGFMGIIAGRMSDRLGPKAVSIFCGFSLGLGFILMSLVNSAWQVYVLYALLGLGVSGLWAPMLSTVARWFVGKRGLFTGIVAAGIGVGLTIFSPVISQLISAYGWRSAYIIIGVIVLVVILTASQFLKRDPGQAGLTAYGEKVAHETSIGETRDLSFKAAIRTTQFWMIAAVYLLFGYNQITIMVHIVPYATGLGIPPIGASGILATIGAASIFGRIIMGGVSDRIRVKPSLILGLVLLLGSMSWLEFANELWALYLFGIFFGFAWGGLSAMQTLIAAELFGLTSLGSLVGIFSFGFSLGGTFGPTISGYIFDVSGSYKLAFLICGITAAVALIVTLLTTFGKKRG